MTEIRNRNDKERRVAIVTGGSRGLGWSMTRALLDAGWNVAFTATNPSTVAEKEKQLAAEFGAARALAVAADVKDPVACERVVKAAIDHFGAFHALINNAGLGRVSETEHLEPVPFWKVPLQRWQDIMLTNAFGPFFMARAAVPHFVDAGFGRIVNISTSRSTAMRLSPYGSTKASLEMMSRYWAADLKDTGVTVNVLLPGGAADTDIIAPTNVLRSVVGALLPASVMNDALLWLLSDASSSVTGRSFVGRLWDVKLPVDQTVLQAMRHLPDEPAII